MDGDGSVQNFVHLPTRRKYPDYRYERLLVSFHSASKTHIEWLRRRLLVIAHGDGYLGVAKRDGRHDFYTLRYGKACAIRILRQFYADRDSPRLVRNGRSGMTTSPGTQCGRGELNPH